MPRSDAGRRRCAIYTRKSSEEGLEQEFNSLAAQREACEAYIRSQQHEGWVLARSRYDDGGFSGGNLERPALQRLLADIWTGRIDIVVVYKVDRLTRSLADFARLVELFDAQDVSFVSVTQQFNTTSSMGRLTLNVLLSFAQFEREVTGERIRDKIAASKKKGMWMGGSVPLGYDADERALVINPAEAETIRRIFGLYRESGCVRRVKDEADRLGLRTKRSTTANGGERGGTPFSRGHIYRLLSNPIYIGRIAHKGQLYCGQHPALIDDETWTAVRDQLAVNAGDHRRRAKAADPSLLAGLLVDAHGERLTPSHAVKKGRRYRYYVSAALISGAAKEGMQSWRLAAQEIEDCVIGMLVDALTSPTRLLERLDTPDMHSEQIRRLLGRAARLTATLRSSPRERAKIVRELVEQVIIDGKRVLIKLQCSAVLGGNVPSGISEEPHHETIEVTAAVDFKQRGAETKLVLPGLSQQNQPSRCDPTLLKAIARGRAWFEELATGRARSLGQRAEPRDLSPVKREVDVAVRLARPVRELRTIARRIGDLVYAVYGEPGREPGSLPWITYEDLMADLPQARWIADRITAGDAQAPVRMNDAESVVSALQQGIGKSLLPSVIGDAVPGLIRLEGAAPPLVREIWLLTHPELCGLPRIQVVRDWLDLVLRPRARSPRFSEGSQDLDGATE